VCVCVCVFVCVCVYAKYVRNSRIRVWSYEV